MNTLETHDEFESKPLIASDKSQLLRLKDVVAGNQTLAFQLKPKVRLFFSQLPFSTTLERERERENLFWPYPIY
jgi:hypothetical protein